MLGFRTRVAGSEADEKRKRGKMMRKRIKKLLAFMLTLAMCVSTTGVGVSAYAEETVVTDDTE